MLTINGLSHELAPGATILSMLETAGIHVPQLCHDPRLAPIGACRLCVVEVAGMEHPLPACSTVARAGMQIATHTPGLEARRRFVLRMLARHYPAPDRGQPDNAFLRELRAYGLEQELARELPSRGAPDATHPYIQVDMSRCIDCRRCERICRELQGQNTWQLRGRGASLRLVPDSGTSLAASSCVSCGACVDTCPSGALVDKTLLQGAPPAHWTRTTCPYCGVGCELLVGTRDDRIVQVRPPLDAPVNKGHLCVKGRYAFSFVDAPDRLRFPLIRGPNGLQEASWEQAIERVASRFESLRATHGPDSIGVLGSARATNEENYVVQKFARMVLGTNNVDCCARVCHAPSAAALGTMLGTGAATNSFDDIERAHTLVAIGTNATQAHPVLGARLRQAAARGARLVVIDPRRTELASAATLHLAPRVGTNVPLLNAIACALIEDSRVDEAFVAAHVDGYSTFREHIAAYTPEKVAATCGVDAAQIRLAARLYSEGPTMSLHGLGVTEHSQGSEAVMSLVNLALLTGNLGKPGAGVNPLRGQNNVQGAAHMGCEPRHLPGYAPLEAGAARWGAIWGGAPPSASGLDLMEMMDAAEQGALKALYAIGYDVLLTNPDTARTRAALSKLEFVVVQDMFLSELARELAHVVLPAASAFEKDGTFMNGERRVQRVRRVLNARGQARSDVQIVCDLAAAMGHGSQFSFASAEAVWDEVRAGWDGGRGMSYARLETSGLQWPCFDDAHPGTSILHGSPVGRVSLQRVHYVPTLEQTDADHPLTLITGRKLFQFNAGTMTGRTENRTLQPTDVLDIHPTDAARRVLSEGDRVVVRSRSGSVRMHVHLDSNLRVGELFTTFHDPHVFVNELTRSHRDAMTHAPEYKLTAVSVEKDLGR